MEHLRSKVLLVLLVLGVAFGSAGVAWAQGEAFSTFSLPRTVRAEGIAEPLGEITLNATNLSAGSPAGATISIAYAQGTAGTITDTVAFPGGTILPTGAVNIVCVINNATVAGGTAPCPTIAAVSANTITLAITAATVFNPTPTAGHITSLTVFGLRFDVSAVTGTTVPAVLSGFSPTPATWPLTFSNPSLTVANILPSLVVSVGTARTALTCNFVATTLNIDVTENFVNALRSWPQEQATSTTPPALQSTAVVFTFTGVPIGVRIAPLAPITTGSLTSTFFTAANLGTWAAAGATAGGTTPAAVTSSTTNAGTITFRYGFFATNLAVLEHARFPFTFSVTAGALAVLGAPVTANVTVSIGPLEDDPSVNVPLFAPNGSAAGALVVSDCVTTLLFPFVTNTAGFDTGIAIANTTSDDTSFGTGKGLSGVAGTCKLDLYPTNADGTAGTAASVTTASVPAGAETLLVLSGSSAFAAQTGYIIAVCNFVGGHGFGFIVDGFGVPGTGISHGYLALVMPTPRALVAGIEGLDE